MLDKLHCYWILIFFTNGVIICWGTKKCLETPSNLITDNNVILPITHQEFFKIVGSYVAGGKNWARTSIVIEPQSLSTFRIRSYCHDYNADAITVNYITLGY